MPITEYTILSDRVNDAAAARRQENLVATIYAIAAGRRRHESLSRTVL